MASEAPGFSILSSPTKGVHPGLPLVSRQHIPTKLLPVSPKGLVLGGTGYGVHGWGPGVWGAVGPTRVFTGVVGETTILPLNSHCCTGLGPEMEGGPAFPACPRHP